MLTAAAPHEALDTQYRVETPEGVALALRPAGLVARGAAFMIDFIARAVVLFVLGALLGSLRGVGDAFWLLSFFVLEWFYPVAFELSPLGATPGKLAVGLRVVMDDGLPVTASASLLRNLLRAADFLPFFYGLGLLSMLGRPDFKRLGDLAASTLVVYKPEPRRAAEWPEAVPQPAVVPLSFDQQRALLHLAGRAGRLTPQRVGELAGLLVPVLPPAEPDAVATSSPSSLSATATRAIGVARWLRGDR